MLSSSLFSRRLVVAALMVCAAALTVDLPAQAGPANDPPWMKQVLELRANAVPGEALDEPMGGKTLKGTPITSRLPECFPAETRDLFWQMDMVPGADPNGPLRPLNFDVDGNGVIDDSERNAIRGRNTWVLWSGGNEGFWNWLTQDGYGITDFLILLDSRNRTNRFVRAGLINQPGFKPNTNPSNTILGLYLDVPIDGSAPNSDLSDGYASRGHVLTPPPWEKAKQVQRPPNHPAEKVDLFEVGDEAEFSEAKARLEAMGDGVDYTVYGYPSGVVGLRLFLNPDFFGTGKGPAEARTYWKNQVQNNPENYYTNSAINMDPKLVRPFRVGMSCGFCHVAPHPLNPPKDPEAPDWANLSTTIGNQYWKPQPAFAVLQNTNSFFYHFLASQQPGTIDTSLVSSDQINNPNTINAIFDVNARLARALLNPMERQSPENVRVRSIEDALTPIQGNGQDWRHTPRVLLDGSDSIGVFGALARVYLNIGTFYEEWARCDNLVIGFGKQRPFSVEVCQRNSVYWQVNERYRAGYLAAFFTMAYDQPANAHPVSAPNPPSDVAHTSTQPMKLIAAKDGDGQSSSAAGQSALALHSTDQRKHGRLVWLDNCAICHSSKQPDGFALTFERKNGGQTWNSQPAPKDAKYILPMDAADWVDYKSSPGYQDYVLRVRQLALQAGSLDGDPMNDNQRFWIDNYLATDIRVPITLAGTPTGRAMASNGLKNHVWDNFSSITYKELPAVGPVKYFDPISATDATFDAPGGGRGYYRPASQVSLWATAPYLHNNALGVYLDDPSVKGRLVQYFDGIRRMLWSANRPSRSLVLSKDELDWLNSVQDAEQKSGRPASFIDTNMVVSRLGDLRGSPGAAAKDAGFIYRLPNDSFVSFQPGFIRPLVEGVAGRFATRLLTGWLWIGLTILLLWLAWKKTPRYLGIVFIGLALLVPLPLALAALGDGGGVIGALLMGIGTLLPFTMWGWRILALTFAVAGVICIQAKPGAPRNARLLIVTLLGGTAVALLFSEVVVPAVILLVVALVIGMVVKWTLPELSRAFFILLAAASVIAGIATNRFVNARPLISIPFANVTVGPLPIKVGPIPRGTPVNLIMNIDPESPKLPTALVSMTLALAEIRKQNLTNDAAWQLLSQRAGQALMDASKCPDFVLDRGHLFGETLDPDPKKNDEDKEDLIAFLETL